MTHVKVKFIRSDIETIVDPARLVWCATPFEMPCQSLFFALLKYRDIMAYLNWMGAETGYTSDLESFKFVHLDNINRKMAAGDAGPARPLFG